MDDLTIEFCSLNDLNAQEWNNFLLSTSESSFFCTIDWWRDFNDSHVLQIRNNRKEIIAGVPFRLVSVIPFIGRFFKFCWLDSSALVNQKYSASDVFYLKRLTLETLIKYLQKTQIIILLISSKVRSQDDKLFKDLGFEIERCATLILDITKSEDEIFKLFSKGNKYSIHKAQKLGVKVIISEGEFAFCSISDFCYLQRKLFENKKESYSDIYYKSESYIKTILSSEYNKSFLAIAYFNDQPAAGALIVSYNNEIYYYLGASDSLITKASQASNFLHFEIIKYAKAKGFVKYDFGNIPFLSNPSDNDYGVYIFKRSFGGDRFEYVHGNYLLRKRRYWIIWKLRKFENNQILQFIYKTLKR